MAGRKTRRPGAPPRAARRQHPAGATIS